VIGRSVIEPVAGTDRDDDECSALRSCDEAV